MPRQVNADPAGNITRLVHPLVAAITAVVIEASLKPDIPFVQTERAPVVWVHTLVV